MSRAVLVLGHGSRNEAATSQFLAVTEMLGERLGSPVLAAFMELASPSLPDAVATAAQSGATEVVVLPLFLFVGMHVARDVPALLADIAEAYPEIRFRLCEPIGADPLLADILLARLEAGAA